MTTVTKSKFRITKSKCECTLKQVESFGLPTVDAYAKQFNVSTSYASDLYAEIRRALKRGDLTASTPEAMEHFLRTSKREGKVLDKSKV